MFRIQRIVAAVVLLASPAYANFFSTGNIVVSVEGNGVQGATSGPYTDNQAAPLTLFQFSAIGTSSATYVNSLVLPQTASGSNLPVSGEYGSTSEGLLQLSGNGQYLTIAGYGINAATYNTNTAPGNIAATGSANSYFPTGETEVALGQTGSVLGQGYTAVPRVIATIDANGNVNSSTGLYGVFNTDNPRSVYSANGTTFYISGQGPKSGNGVARDNTGGVFYTTLGSSTATSITGNDDNSGTSQDTRDVQIYNGQLYVSADSTEGSGHNRSFIGTLGTGTPTTLANSGNGPTQLPGTGTSTGKYTITAATTNGINSAGQQINLSPESFFFANSTTLYIADSGDGKQSSATSSLGDGGLQKWTYDTNPGDTTFDMWVLDYTIYGGLGLVANSSASGTTGLLGLAGEVVNGQVELFATNYTLGDEDPTYLFGVTDPLSATTLAAGESFTELAAAPADSNFKGVAIAPTAPEPASFVLFGLGLAALVAIARRKTIPAGLAFLASRRLGERL